MTMTSHTRSRALALILGGCAGPEPDSGARSAACHAVGPDSVEIGTGVDAFERIDGPLPLISGPQGGQHIWGALRIPNASAGGFDRGEPDDISTWPVFTWTVEDPDGVYMGGIQQVSRTPTPSATDALELSGETVFITDPDGAQSSPTLRLSATVADRCGVQLHATADITVGKEP